MAMACARFSVGTAGIAGACRLLREEGGLHFCTEDLRGIRLVQRRVRQKISVSIRACWRLKSTPPLMAAEENYPPRFMPIARRSSILHFCAANEPGIYRAASKLAADLVRSILAALC